MPHLHNASLHSSTQARNRSEASPFTDTVHAAAAAQSWIGTVTQLIPPHYGIVDGNAFYAMPVVTGQPPVLGDSVVCEAIPNTDGGMYAWRLLRIEVHAWRDP